MRRFDQRLEQFIAGKAAALTGCAIAVSTVAFILLVHAFVGAKMQYADYLNSFYVAGLLVRTGRAADLYPDAQDVTFTGTAFDRFAHTLVPGIPADAGCNFLYPPALALVFSPFTLLPASASFLLWQATSLISLAIAAFLFSATPGSGGTAAKTFFISFLALTVVHILLWGQIGITFGVLPLAAGYHLWQRERYFLCGIIWSLLSIKLQTFLPVVLIAGAQLVAASFFRGTLNSASRLKAAIRLVQGLVAGVVLFQVVPLLYFGLSSLAGWLRAVNLVTKTLADPHQVWASHLIASLPGVITCLSPADGRAMAISLGWLVSLSFLLLVFILLVGIAAGRTVDGRIRKELLIVIAYLSLPLIPHYLRIYDYSICLVPAWIGIFRADRTEPTGRTLFKAPVMLFFALDVYLIALFLLGKSAITGLQICLVIALIECWRQVAWSGYRLCVRPTRTDKSAT